MEAFVLDLLTEMDWNKQLNKLQSARAVGPPKHKKQVIESRDLTNTPVASCNYLIHLMQLTWFLFLTAGWKGMLPLTILPFVPLLFQCGRIKLSHPNFMKLLKMQRTKTCKQSLNLGIESTVLELRPFIPYKILFPHFYKFASCKFYENHTQC